MESQSLSAPRRSASTLILFLIIGIVAGFAGGVIYERKDFHLWRTPVKNQPQQTTEQKPREGDLSGAQIITLPSNALTGSSGPSVSFDNGAYTLTVNGQSAGSAVILTNVTLAERSWIAIHDERNGVPGVILGAGRFPTEMQPRISVSLAVPTESGKNYYVMIHTNSPDDVFNPNTDTPRKDASGVIMMVRFATLP